MNLVNIDNIERKEFMAGIVGRVVHSDNMTVIYWEIKKGTELPTHSHHNEQLTQLTSGKFDLTVDGKTQSLKTNNIVLIPGNTEHSGFAHSDVTITDVFYPLRDDLL